MKVVRLSTLSTGRLYPHFCYRLNQPQGRSEGGRIMSMKYSNDTIGNRTRDLPACSAVPQPTAPPRTPFHCVVQLILQMKYIRLKQDIGSYVSDVICSSFLLNIGCVPKYECLPEYKNLNRKYFYLTKGPKYKRETISLELFCSLCMSVLRRNSWYI